MRMTLSDYYDRPAVARAALRHVNADGLLAGLRKEISALRISVNAEAQPLDQARAQAPRRVARAVVIGFH